jgi:hypothetical protein
VKVEIDHQNRIPETLVARCRDRDCNVVEDTESPSRLWPCVVKATPEVERRSSPLERESGCQPGTSNGETLRLQGALLEIVAHVIADDGDQRAGLVKLLEVLRGVNELQSPETRGLGWVGVPPTDQALAEEKAQDLLRALIVYWRSAQPERVERRVDDFDRPAAKGSPDASPGT